MIDNRVLREMYGPQREEVTGRWRKLHNEKFSNTCLSPDIIRVIR